MTCEGPLRDWLCLALISAQFRSFLLLRIAVNCSLSFFRAFVPEGLRLTANSHSHPFSSLPLFPAFFSSAFSAALLRPLHVCIPRIPPLTPPVPCAQAGPARRVREPCPKLSTNCGVGYSSQSVGPAWDQEVARCMAHALQLALTVYAT